MEAKGETRRHEETDGGKSRNLLRRDAAILSGGKGAKSMLAEKMSLGNAPAPVGSSSPDGALHTAGAISEVSSLIVRAGCSLLVASPRVRREGRCRRCSDVGLTK